MDLDSNGKVSLDEVLSFSAATQKQMAAKESLKILEDGDSDKDGKLSLAEYMKDMTEEQMTDEDKAHEDKKFKMADADGDGLLSEVELPAMVYPEIHEGALQIAAQSTLEEKDIDKDGLLTAEEFWAGMDPQMAESEEGKRDFKTLDKDGNGRLNLEELKVWESGDYDTIQTMEKLMEATDKDNDLHVTSEEIVAGQDSMDWRVHNQFVVWAEQHEL